MKHNTSPLAGKTILVTRPAHQAETLIQLINSAGGSTILFPTLIIESTLNHLTFQQTIKKLDQYDKVIFTSANAVNSIAAFWHPQKPPFVIAIGPGTAAALSRQQIKTNAIPTHFSSEGILALDDLQQLKNKKIAIFCGENPRPFLREILLQRGAQVDEAICYRRCCPFIDSPQQQWLMTQTIDYIVSSSSESLENLFSIFDSHHDWLCQISLVVISSPMATLAKKLGFQQKIIIADNASDGAVVQTLIGQVQ